MLYFALRRLTLLMFTLLMLSIVSFSLGFLFPGDIISNLSGITNPTPEQVKSLTTLYKLDQSIFHQYFAYTQQILSGNFGISMFNSLPIINEMHVYLPATIELCFSALFIAVVFGVTLGFVAAIFHNKWPDKIILTFAMIGCSIPVFWLALIFILIFSILLPWFPSGGQLNLLFDIKDVTGFIFIDIWLSDLANPWVAFEDAIRHIILPAITVSITPMTIFIRLSRTSMLNVLDSNYIKAAKAKGLGNGSIIYHHGIRNALVQIIRQMGLHFANLVSVVMVAEVVFSWQGIGSWLIESIFQRDYTAIQGVLIALAVFTFIINLIADFLYVTLNPIERYKRHGS